MDFASRGVYRGQVTKLTKEATKYLEDDKSQAKMCNSSNFDTAEEELIVYLERLRSARESLNKANEDVRPSIKPEDSEREFECVAEYDDKAISTIARLNQRLLKIRELQKRFDSENDLERSRNVDRHANIKLPKLKLKEFSGDIRNWQPFWEQFKSTVHENSSLSGADKFNYLQTVLTGKAAASVSGFTPTQACYDAAISLLQEEYGQTDKIIDKNMQQLLSIQPVTSKHDVIALRKFYNTVLSSTRSLTALGVPSTQYYVMLKSVLLKCMPSDLRIEYYRIAADDDKQMIEAGLKGDNESISSVAIEGDAEVNRLFKFLKREVEALEKSGSKYVPSTSNKQTSFKTAAGLFTTTTASLNFCFFCKANKHSTADCDSDILISKKKDMLKREGRCFRCTKRGHTTKTCAVRVTCRKCKGKHASTMCEPNYLKRINNSQKNSNTIDSCVSSIQPTLNLCAADNFNKPIADVYLQTACVHASDINKNFSLFVRVIFDGGSQLSFVREDISQKLNLPIIGTHKVSVIPFGCKEQTTAQICNRVQMLIKSQHNDNFFMFEAVEVPNICLDCLSVPDENHYLFSELQLADARPTNLQPESGISILIGADQYWNFVDGEIQRFDDNLTAINTVFGWTLHGKVPEGLSSISFNTIPSVSLFTTHFNEFDFRKLWHLETLGINNDNVDDNFTDIYSKNCIAKSGERYSVSLPWKNLQDKLDSNKSGALYRLYSLTRKLSREAGKLFEYDNAMRDFISSGFGEEVTHDLTSDRIYYLPHRPVYRNDKRTTKLRIVFDASAHAPNELSLNDHLHTGSNFLVDILKILLNFRMGQIGLIADIEKAFLQILLNEEDRDSHRFLWYSTKVSSSGSLPTIQEYRMTRVTFGVTCSPFLLGATIQKHLDKTGDKYRETCNVMRDCFYMDDLVMSANNENSAMKLFTEATVIMRGASMNLRQWNSNSNFIRSSFGTEAEPPVMQKVLGVPWFVITDELAVNIEPVLSFIKSTANNTKRSVLQIISRVYDPLGLLLPCIVRLKIIFQDAWRLKLDWDSELPSDLLLTWKQSLTDLIELKDFAIPRPVLGETDSVSNEVHIFSDASVKAYGCVAYFRSTDRNGMITVRFLIAKTRIAPLKEDGSKELTLPRLELTATLIAARLCAYLHKNLNVTFKSILWTDSKITLHWIYGNAKKWKPYVANRVEEIRKLTNLTDWRYCPGAENPADLLTRGIRADKLTNSIMWMNGPDWLKLSMENWPRNEFNTETKCVASLKIEATEPLLSLSQPLLDIKKYSSWRRLLRVTSYCLRFIDRTYLQRGNCKYSKFLTADELKRSELHWIIYIQRLWYSNEFKSLTNKADIPRSSKILTLNPMIDEEGVIRICSRLRMLEDYQTSNPIILPKESYLTELIMKDVHETTMHGGVNLVLSRAREKFWIPKARQLIRKVIKDCRFCRKMYGKPVSPPYAPLPRERLISSQPFETTGIDFAGPLYTKKSDVDGTSNKVYILLFTCAAVRAVHLELTQDLTTESCCLALRRFIARRGIPSCIYSDNARTFKRASKELAVLQTFLNNEKLHDFLSHQNITWKFIVERAPWWGGFWERMVRSVKNVLKAAIKKSTLNNDELNTLLIETEAIVNSRPLTYISDDPLDLSPLTPNHFLLGTKLNTIASPLPHSKQLVNQDIRNLWLARCKLADFIWKRWKLEYLQQLRSLHHNKGGFSLNLKLGDVVQIYDSSAPRLFWKLAVVEVAFPGRDGKVRACLVRLSNGSKLRRPVQHLYPIEVL